MMNGLLVLLGNKNRISWLIYKLLHAVLTEDGVSTQEKPGNDINTVLKAVQTRTKIKVRHYDASAVEGAIRKLHFKDQVAVCLVDAGCHAILLTGRSSGWIEAFDPDWDGVKSEKVVPHAYIIQPSQKRECQRGRMNILINESYLLKTRCGKKGGYSMGAVSARSLTVMERR
jgi:hypothetical protein